MTQLTVQQPTFYEVMLLPSRFRTYSNKTPWFKRPQYHPTYSISPIQASFPSPTNPLRNKTSSFWTDWVANTTLYLRFGHGWRFWVHYCLDKVRLVTLLGGGGIIHRKENKLEDNTNLKSLVESVNNRILAGAEERKLRLCCGRGQESLDVWWRWHNIGDLPATGLFAIFLVETSG